MSVFRFTICHLLWLFRHGCVVFHSFFLSFASLILLITDLSLGGEILGLPYGTQFHRPQYGNYPPHFSYSRGNVPPGPRTTL